MSMVAFTTLGCGRFINTSWVSPDLVVIEMGQIHGVTRQLAKKANKGNYFLSYRHLYFRVMVCNARIMSIRPIRIINE